MARLRIERRSQTLADPHIGHRYQSTERVTSSMFDPAVTITIVCRRRRNQRLRSHSLRATYGRSENRRCDPDIVRRVASDNPRRSGQRYRRAANSLACGAQRRFRSSRLDMKAALRAALQSVRPGGCTLKRGSHPRCPGFAATFLLTRTASTVCESRGTPPPLGPTPPAAPAAILPRSPAAPCPSPSGGRSWQSRRARADAAAGSRR